MTLKQNRAGQLVIPAQQPKSEKCWLTIQLDRSQRNAVSKMANKLNLNISKYVRKKLQDLLDSANHGQLPKDVVEMVDLECSKCKQSIL